MRIKNIVLLIMITLFFQCKKTPTESEVKPFLNTLWTLELFNISGENTIPPEDQLFNIRFLENNTFIAKSDCNDLNGHLSFDSSNHVNLSNIFTTKIYCGEESFYEEYFETLKIVDSYEIVTNRLYLFYRNDLKLIFLGE